MPVSDPPYRYASIPRTPLAQNPLDVPEQCCGVCLPTLTKRIGNMPGASSRHEQVAACPSSHAARCWSQRSARPVPIVVSRCTPLAGLRPAITSSRARAGTHSRIPPTASSSAGSAIRIRGRIRSGASLADFAELATDGQVTLRLSCASAARRSTSAAGTNRRKGRKGRKPPARPSIAHAGTPSPRGGNRRKPAQTTWRPDRGHR